MMKTEYHGLEYVKPITESDDYANVVNFKNLRTYQYSLFSVTNNEIKDRIMPLVNDRVRNVESGGEILFNFPVDIKKENIIKCADLWDVGEFSNKYALNMNVIYTDNTSSNVYIYVDANNSYNMSNNISKDADNTTVEFTMIKDTFFSNLLTGVRYNGSKKINDIVWLQSMTALVYNTNKFYNDKGISEKKGKISNTGIIETTIDMNNSWKTIQEVAEIAKTYLNKNSLNYGNKLEIKLDQDIIKIGDTIKINKFGINNEYIVTDINEKCSSIETEYIVKMQNENFIGNFIDVFRQESPVENQEKNYKIYVTHYSNDEIIQSTEVII